MRRLLVQADRKFILTIPDDAEVTFGPWSPPNDKSETRYQLAKLKGTLRVYSPRKKEVLAVFSDVVSFRDMSIGYAEEVAKEEGATIWKDDENGYYREDKVQRKREWVTREAPALGKPSSTDPDTDIPF